MFLKLSCSHIVKKQLDLKKIMESKNIKIKIQEIFNFEQQGIFIVSGVVIGECPLILPIHGKCLFIVKTQIVLEKERLGLKYFKKSNTIEVMFQGAINNELQRQITFKHGLLSVLFDNNTL